MPKTYTTILHGLRFLLYSLSTPMISKESRKEHEMNQKDKSDFSFRLVQKIKIKLYISFLEWDTSYKSI